MKLLFLMSGLIGKTIEVDRFFMRPAEVDALCGDYSKAQEVLGWKPKVKFEELVKIMVDHDCELLGVSKDEETKPIYEDENESSEFKV